MDTERFEELGDLIDATQREKEVLGAVGEAFQEVEDLLEEVDTALGELPYNDFATLRSRYLEGFSLKELVERYPFADEEEAREKSREALRRLCAVLEEKGHEVSPRQAQRALRALRRRNELRAEEQEAAERSPVAKEKSRDRAPEERLETEVGASEEGPIEGEDPRATALKALVIAFARRQQRALQCFRRPRFRLRGSGEGEQAVETPNDLRKAIEGLLSGEEEEVLRELPEEEGTESPKGEGLSFRLRYEADEEQEEGAVVFEDICPAGRDAPVESFELRFERGDATETFKGEDGSVRVPIEVLTDLLGERYTFSIEH